MPKEPPDQRPGPGFTLVHDEDGHLAAHLASERFREWHVCERGVNAPLVAVRKRWT